MMVNLGYVQFEDSKSCQKREEFTHGLIRKSRFQICGFAALGASVAEFSSFLVPARPVRRF
jgi:hypothetical protein